MNSLDSSKYFDKISRTPMTEMSTGETWRASQNPREGATEGVGSLWPAARQVILRRTKKGLGDQKLLRRNDSMRSAGVHSTL